MEGPRSGRSTTAGPWLFAPAEFELRASGAHAPLGRPSGRPSATRVERELRRAEDRRVLARLQRWGGELGRLFGLRAAVLEAEREGVVSHYGICYADGLIRIRLRHAATGRPLKESSLVDTLCHELAHLRHMDHGPRFLRLYREILEAARRLGYYRPGRMPRPAPPRQASLFGAQACGLRPARPGS